MLKAVRRGAHVLTEPPNGNPDIFVIATGSEISLSVAVSQQLIENGIPTRIVSLSSWELCDAQLRNYHDPVLPPSTRTRLPV